MKIKKTIAAVAAAAMVFTSVPMVAFAAAHTHGAACYEIDGANGHHLSADNCTAGEEDTGGADADGPVTAHSGWTKSAVGKKACGVCGYITACEHETYVPVTPAAVPGTKKCSLCDATADCTSHNWIRNAADGAKKCSLCGKTETCDHSGGTTWIVDTGDSNKHKKQCKDCEAKLAEGAHAAATAGVDYTTNDTQHWLVCSTCGIAGDKTNHSTSYDRSVPGTSAGHTLKCECGYTETEAHSMNKAKITVDGVDDAANHEETCSTCGYKEVKAHTFTNSGDNKECACTYSAACEHVYDGWKADSGEHKQACSVCGKIKTGAGATSHEPNWGDWETDADKHWKTCKDCDLIDPNPKGAHVIPTEAQLKGDSTLVKDKCTTCGYVKTTTPEQKPEDKPEQKPEDKPEQKPEETTPTTPAESSGSSSSSSGGAVSGNAGTVPTVSSASDMRTSNNTNVNIKASETKVTPAIVNAFVKNKKTKTMTITYGTTMRVAISKSDIKGTPALDFSVSGNKFLSSKLLNSSALAKAKTVVQIDFVNKGKIDGIDKVTVQSRVGGKYAGEKATVYEYSNGKLVKVATAKVGGSGLVSFKVDHLGQYVVVVG